MTRIGLALLACAGLLGLRTTPALAHAVCGSRIFPVTLTMDDPGVSAEASLPTFIYQRDGADGGPGAVHNDDFAFEYDTLITTNLGVGFNYGWNAIATTHAKTETGFEDLVVTPKYQDCISPDHEFIVSLGVQTEFGGTGTNHIGSDTYGNTAPTVYFGKGLGDVPLDLVRPFAITGEFDYSIADRGLKQTSFVNPATGLLATQFNNGNNNAWYGAMSLQYSIPYLQSQVKDYGLPSFFAHLIPLVEIDWTSPATAPSNLGTTWTVAPGFIYLAQTYEVGVEALIPANKAAGSNVGVIAMFHIFLDDLAPNSLGKPLADFF